MSLNAVSTRTMTAVEAVAIRVVTMTVFSNKFTDPASDKSACECSFYHD